MRHPCWLTNGPTRPLAEAHAVHRDVRTGDYARVDFMTANYQEQRTIER
jgi:hypothetical protein